MFAAGTSDRPKIGRIIHKLNRSLSGPFAAGIIFGMSVGASGLTSMYYFIVSTLENVSYIMEELVFL